MAPGVGVAHASVQNGEKNLEYHNVDTTYPLAAGITSPEIQRLNAQHNSIKAYFGGNNVGAPWPENPKKILEIGVGTGAWATEVARQFPRAEVVGVDVVEPVLADKPPNFTFHNLNIIHDPWPFPDNTFDIVHCRFVCMHIPNFRSLMDKAIASTVPGGIVMFEDQDLVYRAAPGKCVPDCCVLALAIFNAYGEKNGVDCRPGMKFAPHLLASHQFTQTCETVVPVPMGDWPADKRLHVIGRGMRDGIIDAARTVSEPMRRFGFDERVVEPMVREIMNPENGLYVDLYCVWGRKKNIA